MNSVITGSSAKALAANRNKVAKMAFNECNGNHVAKSVHPQPWVRNWRVTSEAEGGWVAGARITLYNIFGDVEDGGCPDGGWQTSWWRLNGAGYGCSDGKDGNKGRRGRGGR